VPNSSLIQMELRLFMVAVWMLFILILLVIEQIS
jgi:hypothetical protein